MRSYSLFGTHSFTVRGNLFATDLILHVISLITNTLHFSFWYAELQNSNRLFTPPSGSWRKYCHGVGRISNFTISLIRSFPFPSINALCCPSAIATNLRNRILSLIFHTQLEFCPLFIQPSSIMKEQKPVQFDQINSIRKTVRFHRLELWVFSAVVDARKFHEKNKYTVFEWNKKLRVSQIWNDAKIVIGRSAPRNPSLRKLYRGESFAQLTWYRLGYQVCTTWGVLSVEILRRKRVFATTCMFNNFHHALYQVLSTESSPECPSSSVTCLSTLQFLSLINNQ